MYDPSIIARYVLPRNISKGLGWTEEGTINLGSTAAYIDAVTPMPENNGKLYTWSDTENPNGGHYVVEVGEIDVNGQMILAPIAGDTLVLTYATDEIIALKQASTLIIPENGILTTYFGTGNGLFIAVADKLSQTYIGGVEGARFNYLEGEGFILDNVVLAYYTSQGILLSRDVGNTVLTQLENVIFDDRSVISLKITSGYTGKLNLINNTLDGQLNIVDLNGSALLKIQNNRIATALLHSNTDFTSIIRNNYIGVLALESGAICPAEEMVGKYWYTLNTLPEMEAYRGNIVESNVIPDHYGYLANYGKVDLGTNGGLPYLLQVTNIKWSRFTDSVFKFSWDKTQPNTANSYRISMHSDLTLFPTFVDTFIDVGDVSSKILESGKTILDEYPDGNDGNQDGSEDAFLDLKFNNVWYFMIQAQYKLGEKLLVHLSESSILISIPVRDTGTKPPPFSVGLLFPVKIQDGNFVLAEKSDSVKSGLYQTIMTNVGERVLHEHGAGLRAFLFEGLIDESLLDIAREHMRNEIETLEPRVKIQGIYFRDYENNKGERAILVNIIYTDLETGEPDNFSLGLGNYGREQNVI